VAIQRIADYKNKQLDLQASREKMAHEVEMMKAQAEMMTQEWAARTKIADIEAAGAESAEDAKSFAASFSEGEKYSAKVTPSQGQAWLLVLLDLFRGLVRPGLTVYLCVLTTLIYLHSRELLNKPMSEAEAVALVNKVTQTILYLTTSCLLWWFGVRNRGKQPNVS
jgi:hypothetical protein